MLLGAGPLKHTAERVAKLTGSHAHLGFVRNLEICHLCKAGGPGLHWEDNAERPPWVDRMFESRPWVSLQAICRAPCDARKPELVFNLSPGRDVAGSTCLLCRLGYSEHAGSLRNLAACLKIAHKIFKPCCFCLKPLCWPRYFSPSFFDVKLLSDFAWSNSPKKHIIVLPV